MFPSLLALLRQEALHPGTVDKILLCQQIQHLLENEESKIKNEELGLAAGSPSARSLSVPRAALASESAPESRSPVPAWGPCPTTEPSAPQPARAAVLAWYAGTLARWRRSLHSVRPLADVPPADRPRIRALMNNV